MKKVLINTTNKEIKSLDNDLTFKQKAFLKRYFETGNGVQSAMETYDTEDYDTAAQIASQNLKKLQQPIKTFMESKGLSLGKLVDVLDEGLKANRVISAAPTDNEATLAIKDIIEVPDHLVRHKYLETAAKWLGVVNDNETNVTATQININLDKYLK